MNQLRLLGVFALAGFALGTGCPSQPTDMPADAPDLAPPPKIVLTFDTRTKQDLDILFVIDNSPSMSPKQKQLATAIDNFIKKVDLTGANYHIGVTSTDIGAQQAPNTPFQPGNLNIPGCDTYKGNDGELQRVACSGRDQSKWSADAKAACTTLCPTKIEPINSDPYLWKQDGITNVLGDNIIGAFKCSALLGDVGCGLESPLEAAKRALDGHGTVNTGFLRQNSVLAVVFVTDEDDCSVQMTSRSQNNPSSLDCTKNGMSTYDCWKNDFRCLANNLKCNESMTIPGTKTGCSENGNGYLESLDKYVRFFSLLRPASKLVLAGIWAPTMLDNPNSDPTKVGKLITDYDDQVCVPGPGITCSTEALNRGKGVKAACLNPTDANFFGQAQLRLSSFIRKFPAESRAEQSICEPANYGTVLDTVTNKLSVRASAQCLGAAPKLDGAGNALCSVGLVDAALPDATPSILLPQCGASCCSAWAKAGGPSAPAALPVPTDSTIVSACTAQPDCYCALPNPNTTAACKDNSGRDTAVAGLWISAAPHQTPAGKLAKFVCEPAP